MLCSQFPHSVRETKVSNGPRFPGLLGKNPGPDMRLPATQCGIAGMIKRVRGEVGCNG